MLKQSVTAVCEPSAASVSIPRDQRLAANSTRRSPTTFVSGRRHRATQLQLLLATERLQLGTNVVKVEGLFDLVVSLVDLDLPAVFFTIIVISSTCLRLTRLIRLVVMATGRWVGDVIV